MVTFPVISSGDPSHVSAAIPPFFMDILSAWCLSQNSTMSFLTRLSPAPVSKSIGVSCLSIPSLIQALFLFSLIFASCRGGVIGGVVVLHELILGKVVLHEHILCMASILIPRLCLD